MKTLLVLLVAIATASVDAQTDASRLLERADAFRGGFDSFVTRVRLTSFEADKAVEDAEFDVSIKGDNSLVKFLSVRNKGQSLLMRGDDMWFFLPAVARPVRITPIQRLLGNVSNGDLARLRYSIDYDATIEGDAEVGGARATVLDLRAKRKGATYQRVRYFLAPADARPLKAEYFLTSGKAVKTATFDTLRVMAGRPTLTRIVIADAARPDFRTTIETLSLEPRQLADKLFNPVRGE